MNYDLPTTVTVKDKDYEIRSDYRAILDVLTALTDAELSDNEKAMVCLDIFYVEKPPIDDYPEALKEVFKFISYGEDDGKKSHAKLMDWEQDFKYIIAPVNKVAGYEVRAVKYLHWWTFLSYYYEIDGDCTFAQIVRIRDKRKRGKRLDEYERRFYRENASDIEFKNNYTEAEDELLKEWVNGTGSIN